MTATCDKNGIPFRVGDVLKVFHFTAQRRREKHYMYKQIIGHKALGGGNNGLIPIVDYFEVSHLNMDQDRNYHIGQNEGTMKDYEIIQGTDVYPDYFKDRTK